MNLEFQVHASVPAYTRDLSCLDQFKWSSPNEVPAIGDDIVIRINWIGRAKVVGYATVSGYLGVMAVPHTPPDWWIRQNGLPGPHNAALVFGAEMTPASIRQP